MTERCPPSRNTVDLQEVLAELGHTPESFARVVGRNASGLRRAIRGESQMTVPMARDIIDGLVAEDWQGDPTRIRQLTRVAKHAMTYGHHRGHVIQPSAPPELSSPRHVQLALGQLMRALSREEVDRIYESVFGAKPGDKNA